MSNDNIETMKAELEAAGYEYHPEYKTVYGDYDNAYILCPDGIKILIENSIDDEAETGLAHAHMLKERELADLRVFVLSVAANDPEYTIDAKYDVLAARSIVEKYNITENEGNDNE